jgi:hypothetical protein
MAATSSQFVGRQSGYPVNLLRRRSRAGEQIDLAHLEVVTLLVPLLPRRSTSA